MAHARVAWNWLRARAEHKFEKGWRYNVLLLSRASLYEVEQFPQLIYLSGKKNKARKQYTSKMNIIVNPSLERAHATRQISSALACAETMTNIPAVSILKTSFVKLL